ncbi:MAG TPA: type II CAAX endopeptidase family protein [Candidatus Elarobacter sp.]|nr:type II CAAX endopeptidase family protein [Candidatus Elarobacter sp.]
MKTSTSDRSPLSPTRSPDTGFVWWQSLLFAVLLLVAMYVPATILLAFLIVAGWAHLKDLQSLSWPLLIAQLCAYAATLAVILPLLPRLAQRTLPRLGLRAPQLRDVALAIAGAIVMFVASVAAGAAEQAIFHLKPDEVQVQLLRAARGPTIGVFVFFACVAAPFVEELTFRGFIFNALRRYLPVWVAVPGSAILFGLAHWQPGNAGAILPLAAAGAVLALVYYRSGSLVASMLTHAIFNSVTVVLVVVFHQA